MLLPEKFLHNRHSCHNDLHCFVFFVVECFLLSLFLAFLCFASAIVFSVTISTVHFRLTRPLPQLLLSYPTSVSSTIPSSASVSAAAKIAAARSEAQYQIQQMQWMQQQLAQQQQKQQQPAIRSSQLGLPSPTVAGGSGGEGAQSSSSSSSSVDSRFTSAIHARIRKPVRATTTGHVSSQQQSQRATAIAETEEEPQPGAEEEEEGAEENDGDAEQQEEENEEEGAEEEGGHETVGTGVGGKTANASSGAQPAEATEEGDPGPLTACPSCGRKFNERGAKLTDSDQDRK